LNGRVAGSGCQSLPFVYGSFCADCRTPLFYKEERLPDRSTFR
jgi:hypothetical protein